MRHHLFSIGQPAARRKENVFWRQLEAREEGRLAQEADHLVAAYRHQSTD